MKQLIKIGLVVAFGVSVSAAMSTAYDLALHDALRDLLDQQNLRKVENYLQQTSIWRWAGFTVLFGFWTAVLFAIDRVVDAILRRRQSV